MYNIHGHRDCDDDMFYKSAQHFLYQVWRAWNTAIEAIFGRWELVVVDNAYIRNGSRSNIGAQPYNIIRK
jgi:hypothetical protein